MVCRAPDRLIRRLDAANQRLERCIVLERDHRHRVRAAVCAGTKVRFGTVPLALGVVPAGEVVDAILLQDRHDAIHEVAVADDQGHFHSHSSRG